MVESLRSINLKQTGYHKSAIQNLKSKIIIASNSVPYADPQIFNNF
ncbi:hypothetical protein D1AOALGA4SA_9545 [Olavius algarvensis Delta 1 endosymbiont]|nr:hypothetical protein D1AOALGA4SA_9545 [Olavius algarvensis Delta 1 endosymbiont]